MSRRGPNTQGRPASSRGGHAWGPQVLPALLDRALLPRLLHSLTRSLTHALVPTLTQALTRTEAQDAFCYACYADKTHCEQCHYSSTAAYYNSYYSTYYSDFFSNYYSTYYVQAERKVDQQQWTEEGGSK